MKIWVTVPFSRPEYLSRVRENFERQHHPDKNLCLIENGAAVGACAAAGFQPDLLLRSDRHQSRAKNVAVEHFRAENAYLVVMDDDDYYSPDYLTEHAEIAKPNQIAGKLPKFVNFDGRYLAEFRQTRENSPSRWVCGATLGGYARDIAHYPVMSVGEENKLCEEFLRRGGKVWATSGYYYAWRRRPDLLSHTWRGDEPEILTRARDVVRYESEDWSRVDRRNTCDVFAGVTL